jgi:hypothetical protein
VLEVFRLDGEPVVDLETEAGKKLMAEMGDYADTIHRPPQAEGLETRESMLNRTQSALLITDDNMVPEWRQVLRFHEAF